VLPGTRDAHNPSSVQTPVCFLYLRVMSCGLRAVRGSCVLSTCELSIYLFGSVNNCVHYAHKRLDWNVYYALVQSTMLHLCCASVLLCAELERVAVIASRRRHSHTHTDFTRTNHVTPRTPRTTQHATHTQHAHTHANETITTQTQTQHTRRRHTTKPTHDAPAQSKRNARAQTTHETRT
jgi:hypothetical protein